MQWRKNGEITLFDGQFSLYWKKKSRVNTPALTKMLPSLVKFGN